MALCNTSKHFTIDDLNNISCNDFRVLHCNIRSLRKNFNNLLELLSIVNCSFHVIAISETFLYSNECNYFPISNYSYIGSCRDSRAGGCGIYVHSGLAVIEKLEPLIEGSEAISLLVAGLDEVPLRITAIYRQPSSDTGRFTDDLHNFLHSISHADHNHIITGDINIDILKQESDSYTDLLHQYSYTHLIEHPTRTTQTSSSCIDHIAINFYSSNVISGTLDKDISDHFPVFAFFENLVQPKSQTFKRRKKYCEERLKMKTVCKPTSCLDLLCLGHNETGVYTIYPTGHADSSIDVFCDQETDGGGWTVFQRRMDGSVDFYRDWNNYKLGFGNLSGEFWLGNDNLVAALQAADNNVLRVDLESFDDETAYAKFSSFNVGDESTQYLLSVSGYSGTAGNSFTNHSGKKFSTKDRDYDAYSGSCAVRHYGAWWYNTCIASNLNGKYYYSAQNNHIDGVVWVEFKGTYPLKTTEMKIRPSL
ncbi:hypothetical protein EB796_009964 [Bugula neritina]|uniref:Fibrinogen C-terminal domain-containing protein n=1 Tax=Bugula neritina TaxID=10212 RepID=A0A7J7K0J5_BUGNE|nr:hypothetical protein EB796_009964 [Bugula neritina]